MTDRETLLSLARRCERATGPDRELDCAIVVAALRFFPLPAKYEGGPIGYGFIRNGMEVHPGHGGDQLVRNFTKSLDAAMSLADRPDEVIRDAVSAMGEKYALHIRFYDPAIDGPYSEALARMVCAAALRALANHSDLNEGKK